jgi:uncharacterized glyoxalase superfamily protein PhnB
MNSRNPKFRGIYLFVNDLDETIRFYMLLGIEIEKVGDEFARAVWPNELLLEFGTSNLTLSYDRNWKTPQLPATNTLSLEFLSNAEVDSVYEKATEAGYQCHLEPVTPPWGSRFCILLDPNGNYIGLHGPRDLAEDRKHE